MIRCTPIGKNDFFHQVSVCLQKLYFKVSFFSKYIMCMMHGSYLHLLRTVAHADATDPSNLEIQKQVQNVLTLLDSIHKQHRTLLLETFPCPAITDRDGDAGNIEKKLSLSASAPAFVPPGMSTQVTSTAVSASVVTQSVFCQSSFFLYVSVLLFRSVSISSG